MRTRGVPNDASDNGGDFDIIKDSVVRKFGGYAHKLKNLETLIAGRKIDGKSIHEHLTSICPLYKTRCSTLTNNSSELDKLGELGIRAAKSGLTDISRKRSDLRKSNRDSKRRQGKGYRVLETPEEMLLALSEFRDSQTPQLGVPPSSSVTQSSQLGSTCSGYSAAPELHGSPLSAHSPEGESQGTLRQTSETSPQRSENLLAGHTDCSNIPSSDTYSPINPPSYGCPPSESHTVYEGTDSERGSSTAVYESSIAEQDCVRRGYFNVGPSNSERNCINPSEWPESHYQSSHVQSQAERSYHEEMGNFPTVSTSNAFQEEPSQAMYDNEETTFDNSPQSLTEDLPSIPSLLEEGKLKNPKLYQLALPSFDELIKNSTKNDWRPFSWQS